MCQALGWAPDGRHQAALGIGWKAPRSAVQQGALRLGATAGPGSATLGGRGIGDLGAPGWPLGKNVAAVCG